MLQNIVIIVTGIFAILGVLTFLSYFDQSMEEVSYVAFVILNCAVGALNAGLFTAQVIRNKRKPTHIPQVSEPSNQIAESEPDKPYSIKKLVHDYEEEEEGVFPSYQQEFRLSSEEMWEEIVRQDKNNPFTLNEVKDLTKKYRKDDFLRLNLLNLEKKAARRERSVSFSIA